jgi:hypothetical protein
MASLSPASLSSNDENMLNTMKCLDISAAYDFDTVSKNFKGFEDLLEQYKANKKATAHLKNLISLKKSINQENDLITFQNNFDSCWKLLSKPINQQIFSFVLPPKFPVTSDLVLQTVLNPIWTMKMYYSAVSSCGDEDEDEDDVEYLWPVGSGSSSIITGPKGCGKTSTLFVLYTILGGMCDWVVPLYWSYETHQMTKLSVYDLLEKVCPNMSQDYAPMATVNRSQMIVFLGEEVQNLYSKSFVDRNIEIVSQIAGIGKSMNNIGIISGSSANIANFCLYPTKYGFDQRYPSLNNSVYTPIEMRPIRDKENLSKVVTMFCGKKVIYSDAELCRLFNYTGGVGRHLHSQIRRAVYISQSNSALTILYNSDDAVTQIVNEMLLKVYDKLQRAELEGVVDSFDFWLNSHAISFDRAIDIIGMHHERKNCELKFSEYLDLSIFILDDKKLTIELLFPAQLSVVLKLHA